MAIVCPSCGQEAEEAVFCPRCGAALQPRPCRRCGADALPGAGFCVECGAPLGGNPRGGSDRRWLWAGWGLALIAVAAAGYLALRPPPPRLRLTPVDTAGAAGVDLRALTPRQAADRLFDRVARAAEAGDTAQLRFFLPMARAAYARLPVLDADARYHVAVLALLAGDPSAAAAQADTILADQPNHLLGLLAAADAARARGDAAAFARYRDRFARAYPAEIRRDRPEYRDHRPLLEAARPRP